MKNIRIIATVLFMAVLGSTSLAQMVSPIDFMRYNPRAVFANPAFYTSDYGYFDFGLGGINFGLQNIGLKYDKFFKFNDVGQPTAIDINNGVANLRDVNYLNTFFNFDVFNCGRRTKFGYFTYTHRIREIESFSYSKDLIQLLTQGNGAFLGADNPANIDLGISMRAFQEFDFGYQMSLLEQLNIGFRFKFLMGLTNLQTNSLNVKLFTDPDTYQLSLLTSADLLASVPYKLTMENGQVNIADKRFNPACLFKNYGYGIDLGAEYIINDQIGVAAAINDLGKINWDFYSYNIVGGLQDGCSFVHGDSLVFAGLSSAQVTNYLNNPNYASQLVDSLKNCLSFNPKSIDSYSSGLFTTAMVRGYYDLTPENRFSAQLMGYNMGFGMQPAVTLAYTGSFSEKYDVVVAYTMMPGSSDNLGVGLSANFGGMLLYVAANNILGFFNPANTSQIHAQFGISFTSGDRVSRAETIVLKDKQAEERDGKQVLDDEDDDDDDDYGDDDDDDEDDDDDDDEEDDEDED